MQYPPVDITIIIEFENLLLAELSRATAMLEKVKEPAARLENRSTEILAVHNPNDVSREFVERMLQDTELSARILGVDAHYYQLKNHAAEEANGDIIVFIDSDVIPNDCWLEEITEPFWQDTAINIVAGASHIEPEGIVGKSFALGWFFPVKTGVPEALQPCKYFFANNVGFRKGGFLRYKFPSTQGGATRGACTQMANSIVNSGGRIWKNNNAQVTHAAPNGLRHFLIRAFAEGRDKSVSMRLEGKHILRRCGAMIEHTYKKIRKAIKQTWRYRKSVRLQLWQIPVSIFVLSSYYILAMLGGYLNIAFPRATAKWWMI